MMTPEEQQLIFLMFARVHEALIVVKDVLKRDGLLEGDDEKAFADAAHQDHQKLMLAGMRAAQDYAHFAAQLKIEVPPLIAAFLPPSPAKPPNSEES